MTKHINIDEILSNCVDKAYEIMDSKSFANPYTDAKQQLYDLISNEIIGDDIKNKHEEVDEGCIVCNTCDHIVDPTDTEFSKDCYCDTTNALKAEQRQKLKELIND